jgi:hypothetical protein
MITAVRQRVTVQPGGVVEVRSPELRAGTEAEVIVLVSESSPAQPTWASFIGSGRGTFKSADEIDAYVSDIRDWGDRDPDRQ